MMKKLVGCLAACVVLTLVNPVAADEVVVPAGHGVLEDIHITQLAIGDEAPDFELFGVDYRYHSLGRYDEARALVVLFICNHCRVSVDYEDTLIALANKYQEQGAQFVAINPNPAYKVAADGFPQMVARATEKGFPFPYLYDETQNTARAYGPERTPHVFVFGPDRKLVYKGSVDNHHEAPFYLSDALQAVLAGEEVEISVARDGMGDYQVFGCTVKYLTPAERAEMGLPVSN